MLRRLVFMLMILLIDQVATFVIPFVYRTYQGTCLVDVAGFVIWLGNAPNPGFAYATITLPADVALLTRSVGVLVWLIIIALSDRYSPWPLPSLLLVGMGVLTGWVDQAVLGYVLDWFAIGLADNGSIANLGDIATLSGIILTLFVVLYNCVSSLWDD